ncbi:MAG: hypothetical protein LBN39_02725 [Planctomycetaceae bacterium]|jgi:hypothetical protein|nr:hypothetical protein [Planctomycetaceae bacterium]
MLRKNCVFFLFCTILSSLLTGCGPKTVAVSGKIVFDGTPGENISVLFQGKAGDSKQQAAFGKTGSDGRYSLKLVVDNKSGAMPGDYVVYLSWKDPDADPNPIEGVTKANPCPYKIPSRAGSGELEFTVPVGGTDKADFEFDSSKEKFTKPGV